MKTGQEKTYDLLNNGVDIVGTIADKGLDTISDIGTSLTLPLLIQCYRVLQKCSYGVVTYWM